ncbi:MAG: hypothetical protein J5585_10475 [Clostridia bacterium]|nr:hypothetical protein [Clostridia bacterium]
MSVRFIKIRLNTDSPLDKDVIEALKGVNGQNTFIKKAILTYAGKGGEEIIAEKIASSVVEKLKSSPVLSVTVPVESDSVVDEQTAAKSADIADDFLDQL